MTGDFYKVFEAKTFCAYNKSSKGGEMLNKRSVFLLACALLMVGFFSVKSFAYLSNIPILDKKDYVKLSDESLAKVYLDVIIEVDAIFASHVVQVFSPKEYQQYKDFLHYKYELKNELIRRQLEVPSIKD